MKRLLASVLIGMALLSTAAWASPPQSATPQLIRVKLGDKLHQAVSGRLLLFAIPKAVADAQAKGQPVTSVDTSPFRPEQVAVAAQNVPYLVPGGSVMVDADLIAYPEPYSQLKAGDYDVQAVLDVHHSYNYRGRVAGDIVSEVVTMHLGGASSTVPTMQLANVLPAVPLWSVPAQLPEKFKQKLASFFKSAKPHTDVVDFLSRDLTEFWGRPIHMHALVVKPPEYAAHPERRYPVVYMTHGYGGSLQSLTFDAGRVYQFMRSGAMPPMIWVLLDEASPTGTVEFADSVNNGPWGKALTRELIPHLESVYRMDGDAKGRFLTGHSSGGWATLWLQVRYPKVFGGTWSTSPDPSDFHDFTGVDLYAPNANVYYTADGKPRPLVRYQGKVIATFKQFAQLERVLGPYGGQMASFEWVFSPKGKGGRPEQMFNRDTGAVNPDVVAYWRDHYDIAYRLKTHWKQLAPDLDSDGGKIHLYVGTADTFYLNGAARKLKAVLDSLHARTHFHFVPGRSHFDVYRIGKDPDGLQKKIAWQMYAIARPDSKLKPPKSSAGE